MCKSSSRTSIAAAVRAPVDVDEAPLTVDGEGRVCDTAPVGKRFLRRTFGDGRLSGGIKG
jgi:hypothetical protein